MNSSAEIGKNELLDILKQMIRTQFNELICILNIPTEYLPSSDKPQTDRAIALLEWAKTPGGCGLEKIKQTLEAMGILSDKLESAENSETPFPDNLLTEGAIVDIDLRDKLAEIFPQEEDELFWQCAKQVYQDFLLQVADEPELEAQPENVEV